MFAFLSGYWKPILAVIVAAGLVFGGIWMSGVWYSRGEQHQALIDQEAVAKATVEDQTKFTEAVHANDQELLELRAYRDSHPAVPISVRAPACVREQVADAAGAHAAPAAAVVLQPVPQPRPDGDLSDADRGAMLQSLAARADEVSANLRAIQQVK